MLTDRQLVIFRAIIDDFIETAHPVGSQTIAEKDNINVSAATVRSVMADLEEQGYLEKTHSSSGRIPSEKGYRYYVDHLIAPFSKPNDMDVIKHIIEDGFFEFEQIVQMSAEILSKLTNYTSIILGPEVFETKLKKIQIVTLSQHTAVAILVTNTGHVEHRTFSIPSPLKVSDMEKMANILNERLYGVPFVQLPKMLNNELLSLMRKYISGVDESIEYLKEIFFHEQQVKLYIGGKSNILTQPEFKDVNKLHSFYMMMENENEIADLLKGSAEGIKVSIGHENEIDAIKDFSLITASYALAENQMGTIALLGPTRMEYRKVIRLLSALSNEMTDVLDLRYKK